MVVYIITGVDTKGDDITGDDITGDDSTGGDITGGDITGDAINDISLNTIYLDAVKRVTATAVLRLRRSCPRQLVPAASVHDSRVTKCRTPLDRGGANDRSSRSYGSSSRRRRNRYSLHVHVALQ